MDKDKRKTESCDETCEVLKFERRNWRIERNGWLKEIGWFRAENKRLKEALEALKGLTHYHYNVCNIDDQSEDEIADFIDQALKNEQKKKEK